MTTVVFSVEAEYDLEEIGDYIAADNPTRALSFVQELRNRCRKVGEAPLAHRARPELGDGVRCCPHGNYLIFFRIDPADDAVVIDRVLHGARDLPAAFAEPS